MTDFSKPVRVCPGTCGVLPCALCGWTGETSTKAYPLNAAPPAEPPPAKPKPRKPGK